MTFRFSSINSSCGKMAESQRITCLRNLKDSSKSIPLYDETEIVTIGRARDVTICLMSDMISKHHATFKKLDGNWILTDDESLNGVYVNGKRILSQEAYTMEDGDVIVLGVNNESQSNFVYKYHKSLKVRKTHVGLSPLKRRCSLSAINCKKSRKVEESEVLASNSAVELLASVQIKKSSKENQEFNEDSLKPSCSHAAAVYGCQKDEAIQKIQEYKERMTEFKKVIECSNSALKIDKDVYGYQAGMLEKLKNSCGQLVMHEQVQQDQGLIIRENKTIESKLKEKVVLEMQSEEEKLSFEKDQTTEQEVLKKEKENYERQLKEKEETIKKHLEEKEILLKERSKMKEIKLIEENLKREIMKKEQERKCLEDKLRETGDVISKEKQKACENLLANFSEMVESELQCTICNEIFVQVTTLNCTHAFCAYCIKKWLEKKNECPICRAPVSSQTRVLVLDNYIDKTVQCLSSDMQERRMILVEERKHFEKAMQKQTKALPRRTQNRATRRDHQENDQQDRVQTRHQVQQANSNQLIVIDNDIEHSDRFDDDSFESSSYYGSSSDLERDFEDEDAQVSGRRRPFYGGYGRCFICGRTGHWANGCPSR